MATSVSMILPPLPPPHHYQHNIDDEERDEGALVQCTPSYIGMKPAASKDEATIFESLDLDARDDAIELLMSTGSIKETEDSLMVDAALVLALADHVLFKVDSRTRYDAVTNTITRSSTFEAAKTAKPAPSSHLIESFRDEQLIEPITVTMTEETARIVTASVEKDESKEEFKTLAATSVEKIAIVEEVVIEQRKQPIVEKETSERKAVVETIEEEKPCFGSGLTGLLHSSVGKPVESVLETIDTFVDEQFEQSGSSEEEKDVCFGSALLGVIHGLGKHIGLAIENGAGVIDTMVDEQFDTAKSSDDPEEEIKGSLEQFVDQQLSCPV